MHQWFSMSLQKCVRYPTRSWIILSQDSAMGHQFPQQNNVIIQGYRQTFRNLSYWNKKNRENIAITVLCNFLLVGDNILVNFKLIYGREMPLKHKGIVINKIIEHILYSLQSTFYVSSLKGIYIENIALLASLIQWKLRHLSIIWNLQQILLEERTARKYSKSESTTAELIKGNVKSTKICNWLIWYEYSSYLSV